MFASRCVFPLVHVSHSNLGVRANRVCFLYVYLIPPIFTPALVESIRILICHLLFLTHARRQQQITELQRQLEAANAAVEKLSQARWSCRYNHNTKKK